MNILENLISAFSVLRGSKLRTILTLLGNYDRYCGCDSDDVFRRGC